MRLKKYQITVSLFALPFPGGAISLQPQMASVEDVFEQGVGGDMMDGREYCQIFPR